MEKLNQFKKKKKKKKNSLSSIQTEVAIKFPKKLYFPAENQLGAERVKWEENTTKSWNSTTYLLG